MFDIFVCVFLLQKIFIFLGLFEDKISVALAVPNQLKFPPLLFPLMFKPSLNSPVCRWIEALLNFLKFVSAAQMKRFDIEHISRVDEEKTLPYWMLALCLSVDLEMLRDLAK